MNDPLPDLDIFEERAAQAQGFRNAKHLWKVLADYLTSRKP